MSSGKKRIRLELQLTVWMNMENIILNKKARHKRSHNLLFHFIVQIGKTNGVSHQGYGYFRGEGNNNWKGTKKAVLLQC